MSEDLQKRLGAVEDQFETSLGQLSKLVDFMGNLSGVIGKLTSSWTEEITRTHSALNGHKEGIEQLVSAQNQIASAVDNLSRQCATVFKLQNERIAALEEAQRKSDAQRLN